MQLFRTNVRNVLILTVTFYVTLFPGSIHGILYQLIGTNKLYKQDITMICIHVLLHDLNVISMCALCSCRINGLLVCEHEKYDCYDLFWFINIFQPNSCRTLRLQYNKYDASKIVSEIPFLFSPIDTEQVIEGHPVDFKWPCGHLGRTNDLPIVLKMESYLTWKMLAPGETRTRSDEGPDIDCQKP